MPDLSVEFAGKTFKNPLVAASATPTKDRKAMKKAIDAGFGAVVAKSLFGNSAAAGRKYPRPRFKLFEWREYAGYPKQVPKYFTLNSLEECSAFDYDDYAKDINALKKEVRDDAVIIASISGSSIAEWEELIHVINGTRADLCEVNISCPFAADMGVKMGAGAVDETPEIVRAVKKHSALPLSVKLSPQTMDLLPLAKVAEQAGADALTLQARLSGFMLDIETAKPYGWGSSGGFGGPYLIGYGLKWVSRIAPKVKIPISAVLGVWDWEDIIRYTMVGATTVQSAAAVMLRGFGIGETWLKGMSAWMDKKGYSSLKEIRGIALKNIITTKEVERNPPAKVQVIPNKCVGCGECVISCFYDAITVEGVEVAVDQEKCDICGMCVEKCPTGAVTIVRGSR
jgi:dihydropyrimidine dehydrogenase (NAD+) subunit PreA